MPKGHYERKPRGTYIRHSWTEREKDKRILRHGGLRRAVLLNYFTEDEIEKNAFPLIPGGLRNKGLREAIKWRKGEITKLLETGMSRQAAILHLEEESKTRRAQSPKSYKHGDIIDYVLGY